MASYSIGRVNKMNFQKFKSPNTSISFLFVLFLLASIRLTDPHNYPGNMQLRKSFTEL